MSCNDSAYFIIPSEARNLETAHRDQCFNISPYGRNDNECHGPALQSLNSYYEF